MRVTPHQAGPDGPPWWPPPRPASGIPISDCFPEACDLACYCRVSCVSPFSSAAPLYVCCFFFPPADPPLPPRGQLWGRCFAQSRVGRASPSCPGYGQCAGPGVGSRTGGRNRDGAECFCTGTWGSWRNWKCPHRSPENVLKVGAGAREVQRLLAGRPTGAGGWSGAGRRPVSAGLV